MMTKYPGRTLITYILTIFWVLSFSKNHAFSFIQTDISGDSLFALGDSRYEDNDYLGSIDFYKLALLHYLDAKDSANISKALNDIGVSYKVIGDFDSAKSYFEKAIALDKLRKDTLRMVNQYYNLSNIYNDKGNYVLATELMIEALTIANERGYEKAVANLNSSLGNLYANQDDYDRALSYHHRAKDDYKNLMDSARYGLVLNNLGNCFIELENWDSAYYYLQNALKIKKLSATTSSIAFTLHNLGNMFRLKQAFDSSEFYLWKAYDVRKEISDNYGAAYTSNELGQLYLSMNRPSDAISFLLEAKSYAEDEENYTILIDNLDALHDYYLIAGDTVEAYQALNKWAALRDSLHNEERVKVLELHSAFELDRKEEERKQQEEKALNQSRLAEQRLMIIGGVTTAALMLVGLVLYVIRQRSKIKALNENLKLVNRDMYHRKKNDYMRLLNEISETNVTISEDIRGQLLASAAVDESLYEEAYDMVDLDDYLDERLEDIADAQGLSAKEVALRTELDRVRISGQRATAILLVLNELMTNSAKHSFADRGGIIHIVISGESGHLRVIYKDDGAPFVSKARSGAGMGQKIIEQVLKTLRTELSREVQGQWNQSSFVIKV